MEIRIPKTFLTCLNYDNPRKITLPTLYKKASTGKTLIWNIELQLCGDNKKPSVIKKAYLNHRLKPSCHAIITTHHGQENGKIQSTTKKIKKGKNIGKSNETNTLTQAILDMQSDWTKQIERRGYVQNKKLLNSVVVRPMLLHKFEQNKKKIKYPAMIQAKLDGVRVIVHWDPDQKRFVFISRTGKEFNYLNHIRDDLKKVKILTDNPNIYIDGELYSEQINFNEIISVCRKTLKLTNEEIKKQKYVKLFIFDLFDIDNLSIPYADRLEAADQLFNKPEFHDTITVVPYKIVNNEKEVYAEHKKLSKKYEGSVIKNMDAPYEIGKRSYNNLKLKDFETDEFEIIGYTDGKGKEEGLIIYILKTPKGKTFMARPEGTEKERSELFKMGDELIGKMVTVRYMEMSPDGVPRMPVALGVREYE